MLKKFQKKNAAENEKEENKELSQEEEVLLPYLKDIFDIIATYNRDINNFSSLKGTLNSITFDEKIEDSEWKRKSQFSHTEKSN